MMFQVLGSFAEYERDMIRARVNAGIARAKACYSARPHLALLYDADLDIRAMDGKPSRT
jgi:DNA invertase Pin-like site-specific DNA recombinase